MNKEIESLVARFESQTIKHSEWKHKQHIQIAVYYLLNNELGIATQKMKKGIIELNIAQGVPNNEESGYHETITVFLLRILKKKIETLIKIGSSNHQIIESCENEFKDFRSVLLDHYSFDLFKSSKARLEWIEPDLKAIDL